MRQSLLKNAVRAANFSIIGAVILTFVGPFYPSFGAELRVQMIGMKSRKGDVHIGLYNNEEDFPGGHSIVGDNLPADRDIVVFTITDLPPGRYAIAGFHDSNGNGKHDVSIFRIEDFVFSQGAKALFRAPGFAEAAFTVTEPMTVVTLDFSD